MTDPVWTLDAVREHFSAILAERDAKYLQRFDALEKAMTTALRSAEVAVVKAETAAEKRLDSVNEFRDTLSDQQRNLMPRSEVGVVAGALTDKLTALEAALTARVNSLEKQIDALVVERQGIKGGWGYAVGIIGFLLAAGSLVMIGIRFVMGTP